MLDREIDAFYRTFVGIVAKGRSRPEAEVEPLARGRVWSGKDASERGLVDHLGGIGRAKDEIQLRLGRTGDIEHHVLWPRPLDLPPIPRTRASGAASLEALLAGPVGQALGLGALDAELGPLLRLARGGDRVLAWAEPVSID